jgi:hypothetical protein
LVRGRIRVRARRIRVRTLWRGALGTPRQLSRALFRVRAQIDQGSFDQGHFDAGHFDAGAPREKDSHLGGACMLVESLSNAQRTSAYLRRDHEAVNAGCSPPDQELSGVG